jgi:hypothetical protein
MSVGLAKAREAAEIADAQLREHKIGCIACSVAARRRRPGELCPVGQRLRSAMRVATIKLQRERLASQQPVPGQRLLF